MISEIDIQDWDTGEAAPLYSVPPKTYIKWLDEVFWFDHLDGMYSYCTAMNGRVVHIGAAAVVTPMFKKEK